MRIGAWPELHQVAHLNRIARRQPQRADAGEDRFERRNFESREHQSKDTQAANKEGTVLIANFGVSRTLSGPVLFAGCVSESVISTPTKEC
jgi:hypothetical protein